MRRKIIPVVTALLLDAGLALSQEPVQAPSAWSGNKVQLLMPFSLQDGSGNPPPPSATPIGNPAVAPIGNPAGGAPSYQSAPPLPDTGHSYQEETFRVSAEYLLWTANGRIPAEFGNVLSGLGFDTNPLTESLPTNSWQNGVRLFASYAPTNNCLPIFEIGGFYLANSGGSVQANSTIFPASDLGGIPSPLFLQPVVGGVILVPQSRGVVDPPETTLTAADTLLSHVLVSTSRELWGTEANFRSRPIFFGSLRLDCLAGFRNVNLKESLDMYGDFAFSEPVAGGNPQNVHTNIMHTFDSLQTQNNFYGGQVGVSFETTVYSGLTLSGSAKLGLGGNCETVSVNGSTLLDATTIQPSAGAAYIPRASMVVPGGLYTPEVPGGRVTNTTHLSFYPDLNITLGYQITPWLQCYVGYNYMYLSGVARLGDQSVNFATPAQGHLELQGADFGFVVRY